jgi:threonyl-tRNA synthetase
MRIITIHADWIEIEPKQRAIKDAEEIEQKKIRSEDCLVVFSAVEARDESALAQVAEKAAKEIEGVAEQV